MESPPPSLAPPSEVASDLYSAPRDSASASGPTSPFAIVRNGIAESMAEFYGCGGRSASGAVTCFGRTSATVRRAEFEMSAPLVAPLHRFPPTFRPTTEAADIPPISAFAPFSAPSPLSRCTPPVRDNRSSPLSLLLLPFPPPPSFSCPAVRVSPVIGSPFSIADIATSSCRADIGPPSLAGSGTSPVSAAENSFSPAAAAGSPPPAPLPVPAAGTLLPIFAAGSPLPAFAIGRRFPALAAGSPPPVPVSGSGAASPIIPLTTPSAAAAEAAVYGVAFAASASIALAGSLAAFSRWAPTPAFAAFAAFSSAAAGRESSGSRPPLLERGGNSVFALPASRVAALRAATVLAPSVDGPPSFLAAPSASAFRANSSSRAYAGKGFAPTYGGSTSKRRRRRRIRLQ